MKKIYFLKILLFFFLSIAFSGYSLTYYSIANTGWNTPSTWSTTSCGGPASITTPGAGDDVVICAGTTVLMDGNSGSCNSLTISGTADWTSAFTTNVGVGGITINSGGNITGNVSGVLTTTGGLVINSNLTSTSVDIRIISISGQVISGTGSLSRLDISANTTNNGSITVTTALTSNTPSILTQGASSSLTYSGITAIAPTLNATAIGNTVTYDGSTQTVKSTTYQNLIISGTNIKTLGGSITVNGNLAINNSHLYTSLYQITGNATGTFTITGAGILTLGNSGSGTNVFFPTNFISANVSFSASSTVYYYGSSAQTISSVPTYGTLYIQNYSGSKSANGNITATSVIVTSPTVFNMSSYTLTIASNLTGTGGLSFTSGTLNIGGNFGNTGAFTCGTGTVNYTGTTQNVKHTTYHHLTISGSGLKTLIGATTLNGNLTINAGTLYTSTYQITGNASGTLSMADGTVLALGNNLSATPVSFPTGYITANISLAATSTVIYYGNSAQTISSAPPSYGHLTIQTFSGNKAADGNITVSGDLTVTSPTTLSMTTYTLSVTGHFLSTGNLSFTSGIFNIGGNYTNSGSFTCGTGTVNYNGSATQTVRGVNYYNLTFSGAGSKTLAASSTIGIAATFTRGTMTVTPGSGNTVVFNGAIQNMTGDATTFEHVTMNNTSLTIPASITVNGTLTFTSGIINTSSNAVIIAASGSVSRTSGHVNGNLTKNVATGSNVSRTFEIGTSADYIPLSITFANVSTSGFLTTSTTASDHPAIATSGFNSSLTINRYWSLNNTGIVYTTYNTTVSFLDADKDVGLTMNNCVIKVYNGSSWSTPAKGTQTSNTLETLSVAIPTSSNSVSLQIGEIIPSTGHLYSIASSNWSSPGTWSSSSGGASCSCIPNFADTVTIENNNIVTMDGAPGTAQALFIQTGGVAHWASSTTTNVGTGGITIAATGDITGAAVGILTTEGGLTINKVLSTTGVTIRTVTTGGQTINGTGTLPRLDISATTTNNANLTVTNSISSTTLSTLTQGPGATLTYNGTSAIVPNLTASALGNTIIYGGNTQTVKSTTYHHLTTSSSGTKTMGGAITVNGNLSVNAGTLYTFTYQIIGNATGTLTVAAGSSLVLGSSSSSTSVLFPTNFITANISLAATSNVYYYGNNAQTISSVPSSYGVLYVQSFSGSKSANGNITATSVIVTSPTVFNMSSYTLTVASNLTGTGGLSFTSGTLNIGGNFGNTGAFTCGTGTVNYTGTTQNVKQTTYHHLTISGSGLKTLIGATTVNGNLTINAGTLYTSTYQITGNASGTLSMAGGTVLALGNNLSATPVSFPTGYITANISLAATSTVIYYGNSAQTISSAPPSYGHLTIQTFSGTKAANGNITVSGDLTVTSPTTLSMTTYTLSVTGHFLSTGNLSFTSGIFNIGGNYTNSGSFTCGTGTVNYNGSATQTVRGVNYYNLTFSGAGSKTFAASSTIGIAATFTRGTMTVTPGSGNTVVFNGAIQNMTGNATTFEHVTMNNTSLTIPASITVNGTLTFTSGIINTSSNAVIIAASGSVSRTSGHVNGNLTKNVATGSNVSRTFEIGTSADYTPLNTVFASVSSAGNLTASVTLGDHPSIGTSGFDPASTVNLYWTVANSGIVFTNYSVTANYLDTHKDLLFNPLNAAIRIYNGSSWSNPAIGTQSSNATQVTTVTIPTSSNTVYLQVGHNTSTGILYSIADGDWSSSSTWSQTSGGPSCFCLPTSSDTVVIENNFTVTMDEDHAEAIALTIQTGGVAYWNAVYTTEIGTGGITIGSAADITGSAAGILETAGGITLLNSSLSSSPVTIKTVTTPGQTISGTGTLSNLDIGINTTNDGTLNLTDVLTITAGTLNNSGTFTLKSDITKYARIAPIECVGCHITGNYTVERYIAQRNIGTWADLSSPVSNSTMQDWDDELFLVYPFGTLDPITNRPRGTNIMAYDEPTASYVQLSTATPLDGGTGFEIGLADDATLNNFTARTLTTTGTMNYGTYEIPLGYTGANGPPYPVGYSGQNLVGNPYASAIDLSMIILTNALPTVDVYDYTIDNYKTLSGSDLIGPYQGFWAYAQSAGASMTVPESAKSTNTNTPLNRPVTSTKPYLNLLLSSADGSHHMEHTLHVGCDEQAKDGWDMKDHPFRKSLNPKAPSITSNAGGAIVTINTFNNDNETYIMPLNVHVGINGKYMISSSGIQYINKDYPVILLEDKMKHTFTDLNNIHSYTFHAQTSNPEDRFVLHFSKSADYHPASSVYTDNLADHISIRQMPGGNMIQFDLPEITTSTISVVDVLGRNIAENKTIDALDQSISLVLPADFRGMYLIVVESAKGKVTKKFTIIK